ncbi:MAG: hypothetical protein ABI867_27990 [Kofleriaceae bacterium]
MKVWLILIALTGGCGAPCVDDRCSSTPAKPLIAHPQPTPEPRNPEYRAEPEPVPDYRPTAAPVCADPRESCKSDPAPAEWTAKCRPDAAGPCHCASAASIACFHRQGCYREAGARTKTTEAELRRDFDREVKTALATNTTCAIDF